MAYSAYQTASDSSEKLAGVKARFFSSPSGARPASAEYADMEKAQNPPAGKIPSVSFGGRGKSAPTGPHGVDGPGFGFGRSGEKAAKLKGYLISKPQDSVTKP